MPLAEDASGITGVLEQVPHGGKLRTQQGAPATHIDCAVARGVQAREQLATGGRTHRRHVKVAKTQALFSQLVEVRRSDNWIAVGRQLRVALIVGHDDDDVGLCGQRWRGGNPGHEQKTGGE